jgi:hypothetical protein
LERTADNPVAVFSANKADPKCRDCAHSHSCCHVHTYTGGNSYGNGTEFTITTVAGR